jgi:hypothetical protein
MTTIQNALPLTHAGFIPDNRKSVFYRVESWNGRFIADFALKSQASEFAITHARNTGCRYDHKVSQVELSGKH